MKRNSYTNILANLDASTTFNSWNNKPVRKLNCVVEITVRTSEHVYTDKVYKPTREEAEKVTRGAYANILQSIESHNKNVQRKNARALRFAEENGYEPWFDDFEELESVEIRAIDRDNIEWTITVA